MTAGLDAALLDIERSFGKGTVARLGDEHAFPHVEGIPTGAIMLDRALGTPMPRGRIVEVFGPESSGKTTIVLHTLVNAQKLGPVAFIDAEHALDPTYAAALGLDVDELLVSQPDYGEQALEVADKLLRSGEMADVTVGAQARMMSQAMRKLAGNANRHKTLLIFTNQIREKVGVIYGSPETQPGGRALKFYASQRLDVRRVSSGSDEHHNRTKVTVRKNKVAPPFRVAEFDIDFGTGISKSGSLIDLGLELGVVCKSGSFYGDHNGERLAQGRDNSKAVLEADPERLDALDAAVRAAAGIA
jgi:recombination protein RecA